MVILDKCDYIENVEAVLKRDNIIEVKNPDAKLNTWNRKARELISSCKVILNDQEKAKLKQSNYQFPRLYALPKVHKPGPLKFRPISSDIPSPNYKIAKWLCNQISKLPQPPGFSIKNTFQFIECLKNFKFKPNDCMVSFDIQNMYHSISADESAHSIFIWLKSVISDNAIVGEYMRLVKLCLGTCYFKFNGKVYQQLDSLAMGNQLSSFAANCFMSALETGAEESYPDFPSIWYRYVDDTFAVIDKDKVDDFLFYLNGLNDRIHLTKEHEQGGSLPFLDLNITRMNDSLEFNIYRKVTNTDRCIPSTSYHSTQTKFSAFNSFCYRAINVPMSDTNYQKEIDKLYTVADMNGFSKNIVDILLKKREQRKNLRDLTTLGDSISSETITDDFHYSGGIFVDGLTTKLARIW